MWTHERWLEGQNGSWTENKGTYVTFGFCGGVVGRRKESEALAMKMGGLLILFLLSVTQPGQNQL